MLTGCSTIPQANADVAFMGDSITNYWWLPRTNLGVPGNTTAQMLARFRAQVLGHGYKAVVILGGTNDVRTNVPPTEQAVSGAMGNLEAMAEMADSEGMMVVLCAIPPIENQTVRTEKLNAAIAGLAAAHSYRYVDYYTPMAGHREYFRDSVHPNEQGYFVMQTALTKVIPLNY